jgi:hypothetical protein
MIVIWMILIVGLIALGAIVIATFNTFYNSKKNKKK